MSKKDGVTVTLANEVERRAIIGALWNGRLYSSVEWLKETLETVPSSGMIGERWDDVFAPVQAMVSAVGELTERADDIHALQETGFDAPTTLHCSESEFLRELDKAVNGAKEALDGLAQEDLKDGCDQVLVLMAKADELRARGVEYEQPVAIGGEV